MWRSEDDTIYNVYTLYLINIINYEQINYSLFSSRRYDTIWIGTTAWFIGKIEMCDNIVKPIICFGNLLL